MKGRSPGVDVLRVVGLCAVVASHLWGGDPTAHPNAVRIATYSWAVPLYFFLMGYFWTRGRTVRQEAISRARRLLVPFLVWTVVIGVPFFAYTALRHEPLQPMLTDTLTASGRNGSIFSAYWFLPVIFLSAVIMRALERVPPWVSWAVAIVGLALCFVFGAELSYLPFDAFFAFPGLFFALVGQQVRRRNASLRHPLLIGAIVLVVGAGLFATRLAAPPDIKLGDFGTPVLTVLASTAICAGLLVLLTHLLDGRAYRWAPAAEELARVSIVVLLGHSAVFFVLDPLHPPTWVIFVAAVVVSWALGVLLHRTPLSPLFVGLPRERSESARAAHDRDVVDRDLPAVGSQEGES